MLKTKGTDIVIIRKVLKTEKKADLFIRKLSPELREVYNRIITSTWYSVEHATKLFDAAAEVFFPDEPDQFQSLGKMMAHETFSGVYRIFLKIPTLHFILQRVSNVWKMYFNCGKARVEKKGKCKLLFIVEQFPEMPRNMRKICEGYFAEVLDIVGIQGYKIVHYEDNAKQWRWSIEWK
jgi:hypothetical protein